MESVNKFFINQFKNHFADFKGRATREEYWMFTLYYFLAVVIIYAIDFALLTGGIIYFIVVVATFIPTVSITTRRLHDIDKSGWCQLLYIIPIIGWIILLVWTVTESGPDNKYGHKKHH